MMQRLFEVGAHGRVDAPLDTRIKRQASWTDWLGSYGEDSGSIVIDDSETLDAIITEATNNADAVAMKQKHEVEFFIRHFDIALVLKKTAKKETTKIDLCGLALHYCRTSSNEKTELSYSTLQVVDPVVRTDSPVRNILSTMVTQSNFSHGLVKHVGSNLSDIRGEVNNSHRREGLKGNVELFTAYP